MSKQTESFSVLAANCCEGEEAETPPAALRSASVQDAVTVYQRHDVGTILNSRHSGRLPTATVLVSQAAAALCVLVALAVSPPESSADGDADKNAPVELGTGLDKFVPMDTSRLMGSPDAEPSIG